MKRGASFLRGHLQKMVQATRAHTASRASTLTASVSWKREGEGVEGGEGVEEEEEEEEEEDGEGAEGTAALRRERRASAAAAPDGRQRRRLSSDQSKSSKASTSVPVPSSFTAWEAKRRQGKTSRWFNGTDSATTRCAAAASGASCRLSNGQL